MHISEWPKQGSVHFIRFPKIKHQICRKPGEKLRNFMCVTLEFFKKFNFECELISKLQNHEVKPSSFQIYVYQRCFMPNMRYFGVIFFK